MRSEKAIRDRITRKDKELFALYHKKREALILTEMLDDATQRGLLEREIKILHWVLEESRENRKRNKRKVGRHKKTSETI